MSIKKYDGSKVVATIWAHVPGSDIPVEIIQLEDGRRFHRYSRSSNFDFSRIKMQRGFDEWLYNRVTREMSRVEEVLKNRGWRFQFNAEEIFGTHQPAGHRIKAWFIDVVATRDYNKIAAAANWIRHRVPLEVLMEIDYPFDDGRTLGANRWHWSTGFESSSCGEGSVIFSE